MKGVNNEADARNSQRCQNDQVWFADHTTSEGECCGWTPCGKVHLLPVQ